MQRPLYVDLNQTLVRTDTLHENMLSLIRAKRFPVASVLWLMRGRAYFKDRLSALIRLDVTTLPYEQELLEDLKTQRDAGRLIFLATGADLRIAHEVADYLGLFSGVLASDGKINLTGSVKCSAIRALVGEDGFDYVGNAPNDIPIWLAAEEALIVNPSRLLLRRLKHRSIRLTRIYATRRDPIKLILRTIRIHQWTKNILLFVPLFLAHRLNHLHVRDLLAFLAFSLTASSVYVINDLLDVPFDRKHPKKRDRPFASGDLSASAGLFTLSTLLVLGGLVAAALPARFQAFLLAYFAIACLYSYRFKKVLFLDAMVLAALYTVRILAGGAATNVIISPWTIGFSIFMFVSLAAAKRVSELKHLSDSQTVLLGRGYIGADESMLCSLGASAGYVAVLVFALYINSADVQKLYSSPGWLWLLCPCFIYWISRIWLLAHRGDLDEDPVLFAIKDRTSLLTAFLVVAIVLLAS